LVFNQVRSAGFAIPLDGVPDLKSGNLTLNSIYKYPLKIAPILKSDLKFRNHKMKNQHFILHFDLEVNEF